MDITLATMRGRLAQDYCTYPSGITFTTTSAGAAGGTTAVCSTLTPLMTGDDSFNGWWILLTSGTYGATGTVAARERLVSDSTQSTGTLTFPAYAGQVATSVTFELHQFQPSLLVSHINRAMHIAYPSFMKRWDNRELVTGNLIPGHFDDWASSSVPDGWTAGFTGCTVTQETTIKRFGTSSCKIVRASSTGAALSISSATIPLLLDQTQIDFKGWCYSATGTAAQLKLTPSSGTAGESGYQSLGSVWELLGVEGYSVPSGITTLTVSLEIDAAATVYFDNVAVFGSAVYDFLLPTGIVKVSKVYLGNDWEEYGYEDDEEIPHAAYTPYEKNGSYYLRFEVLPPSKRKLRVVGTGYFADLSSDTDSVAMEATQGDILTVGAASLLLESMAMGKGQDERIKFLDNSQRLRREFETRYRLNPMDLPLVSRYSRPECWG